MPALSEGVEAPAAAHGARHERAIAPDTSRIAARDGTSPRERRWSLPPLARVLQQSGLRGREAMPERRKSFRRSVRQVCAAWLRASRSGRIPRMGSQGKRPPVGISEASRTNQGRLRTGLGQSAGFVSPPRSTSTGRAWVISSIRRPSFSEGAVLDVARRAVLSVA
jgi:hypothetical protein